MELEGFILLLSFKFSDNFCLNFFISRNYLYLFSFRGVMVKVLDCGLELNEFAPQSRKYIHFQTNTLGKGKNALNSVK